MNSDRMFSFWSLFRKATEEEKDMVKQIQEARRIYPSLKVTGRGAISIDHKDFIKRNKSKRIH